MANFQVRINGTWTDIPSYAFHGTYEGTVELRYPQFTDYDGLGRPCGAVGKPVGIIQSPFMTGCGMGWWNARFDAATCTTSSIVIKLFNPRTTQAGANAWTSCSGWLQRPTYSRVRPGGDNTASANTYYYDVEIRINNCEAL
jgi:hypothetical protein